MAKIFACPSVTVQGLPRAPSNDIGRARKNRSLALLGMTSAFRSGGSNSIFRQSLCKYGGTPEQVVGQSARWNPGQPPSASIRAGNREGITVRFRSSEWRPVRHDRFPLREVRRSQADS
jgi:hypothetical protein